MLPLTVESAFPEEAGLQTAEGALATPEDFDGDLAAFLGGIRAKNNSPDNENPLFNRASKYEWQVGTGSSLGQVNWPQREEKQQPHVAAGLWSMSWHAACLQI